jgi:hypothetical protein
MKNEVAREDLFEEASILRRREVDYRCGWVHVRVGAGMKVKFAGPSCLAVPMTEV